MRYRREHLLDRKWHKVILHNHNPDVFYFLKNLQYDYMCQSGGHWLLLMIENEIDLVYLRFGIGFTDEDYRGYGDWSKKKYHSAETNRIT